MIQNSCFGEDKIFMLKDILSHHNPKKILLVTGKNSLETSGAAGKIAQYRNNYDFSRWHDFSVNPKLDEIKKGIEFFRHRAFDFILAIGGGSVLDTAKLIRILSCPDVDPNEIIIQPNLISYVGVPLVALPTTAGTGSEVTHFAVVYIQRKKHSVAHDYILPDYAIIDPTLSTSMSPELSATTGLDVLC